MSQERRDAHRAVKRPRRITAEQRAERKAAGLRDLAAAKRRQAKVGKVVPKVVETPAFLKPVMPVQAVEPVPSASPESVAGVVAD